MQPPLRVCVRQHTHTHTDTHKHTHKHPPRPPSFFSTLFLRAAKIHRVKGGGSMTMLPLVPGRPATGGCLFVCVLCVSMCVCVWVRGGHAGAERVHKRAAFPPSSTQT